MNRNRLPFFVAAWLLLCAACDALAQSGTPTTEKMIEQLQAPRTRSLRNLAVEEVRAKEGASQPMAMAPESPAGSNAGTASASASMPVAVPASLTLLIQFDFDSASVRPQSEQALLNLTQALQSSQLKASRFAIEGHTDAKGREGYNQTLSEQRAWAVREFLKIRGVDPTRLLTVGKGSSELADPGRPFAAENRRVRIVNLD